MRMMMTIMINDDNVKVVSLKPCIPETNINWKNTAHCFHPNQPLRWQAAMKYSRSSTDLVCGNTSNPNKILTKVEILYSDFSYHYWQCYKLKIPETLIKFNMTSFPEKTFAYLHASDSTFVTTHAFLPLEWEFKQITESHRQKYKNNFCNRQPIT